MYYLVFVFVFVLVFFSSFSIAITSLWEENAFLTFVRFALVWFCLFPLPLGVWEGLGFVIVALPGLFSYFFCPSIFRCSELFKCFFFPVKGIFLASRTIYHNSFQGGLFSYLLFSKYAVFTKCRYMAFG